MKATILLTTNPGNDTQAYATVKGLSSDTRVLSAVHCLGRFDGVITCDVSDVRDLNDLAEALRRDGVFHTETLVHIE